MIDEVRGNNYYSESIAFELDDSDIKETIRPYSMGQDNRRRGVLRKLLRPRDPDEPAAVFRFDVTDELLPWNNGSFTVRIVERGKCRITDEPAEYEMGLSIATLTTLLLGYKTAEKLYVMDRIKAEHSAVEILDDILFHTIPYVSDYI